MFRRLTLVLAIGFVAGAAYASNKPAVTVGPTAKASFAEFVSLSAQENEDAGCPRTIINGRVRVTANINNGGGQENFGINAWDDGNFRTGVGFSVPVGATAVYDFQFIYAFEILQGASGVGVYIQDAVGPPAVQTWASNGNLNGPLTGACPAVGDSLTLVSLSDGSAVHVPALAPAALGLLTILLGALGLRARRRRS
jgi:hypothetical protein